MSGQSDSPSSVLALLTTVAGTLDSLDVATCVFDEDDRALLWNRTFVKIFPEHAAHIRVGEPYRDNLRRFYVARLDAAEMPAIEQYIEQGIARHRNQQRPFSFVHRGMKLTVASLPLAGVGRIRIWKADTPVVVRDDPPIALPGSPTGPPIGGAALFDHLADGVMVTRSDNRVVWVNEPFQLMYGYGSRDAALGASFEEIYRYAWRGREGPDRTLFDQGLQVLTENMRFAGAPFEIPLPDGRWTRVIEQRSPDGKSFFVHVDITVLKRQQQQLLAAERRARDSEALLQATLERMDQGIMMVDAQRIVQVCNRRAIELLGLPPELMASKPTFEAVLEYQWSTDEFRNTPPDIQEFVRSGGILETPQCYDRTRPDGRVIEIHSVPIEGGGVLRTYTDVTQRKKAEERVRHLAQHDSLTSLVNREAFLGRLNDAVEAFGRTTASFAVHFIDLDRFKPINDQFGHAVGDKVLSLVAERMRQAVRSADVIARLGGDEFALLQYSVERSDSAEGLAQRLLQSLTLPLQVESLELQIGVSIGIAHFRSGGNDADTLLRNADAAMYEAKASGGNCVRVYGAGNPSLPSDPAVPAEDIQAS